MKKIIFFVLFGLVLFSCARKKNVVYPTVQKTEPICGGNFDNIELNKRNYLPISIISIFSLTKELDTFQVNELLCSDSTYFTSSFSTIKVPELCIELGFQGKTFYSVMVNDTGGFQYFKVLRKVDKSFDPYDEKVKLKLENMKLIDNKYFNSELIFYHEFRLE